MTHKSVPTAIAACLVALASPTTSNAQIGGTTDIITGVIVDAAGEPLQDVIVEALSLETQISRTTRSNARGRYTILFPDGGGQYRMTARMIGLSPRSVTLVRYADEDRLVWDVEMSDRAIILDAIEVEGRLTPVVVPDRPTPGSAEQALNAGQVARLPIDAEDLNVLATLVPGVVGIDGTDSTGAAFSVAGQRPDANQITLDGLSFESGQVPQEGLRTTRVITSTYDVSRGRFSGGQIASTSRSGSNRVQGSFRYTLRDDDLSFGGDDESPFSSGFSQNQIGGGVGGPLIHNRLFVYLSAQTRLRNDAQTSLTDATTTDLFRLGIEPDSVARFLGIVDAIGAAPESRFEGSRSNDRWSGLLRADYLASNSHTISLRGDLRLTEQEPSRLGSLSLPETAGVNENTGGGIMATVSSRIGLHVINEVRAYYSRSSQNSDPFVYLPLGRVRVASELEDGTVAIKNLTLGGNSRMPNSTRNTTFEIAEEASWLPGRGQHRFKFGVLINAQSTEQIISTNQLGTYTFNSLADLEAGVASSFRRTLTPTERTSRSLDWGVYAGDIWRLSSALQVTYGARFEGSSFSNPPAYNPDLETAFGFRTDRLPSETFLSPRAGFTLTMGAATPRSQPTMILRGGAGFFRSPMSGRLVSQAQSATGLTDSEAVLACIGATVPVPDWNTFAIDPSSIPSDCIGAPAGTATVLPSATVFADDFAAPKTFRTSLGIQRNLTPLIRLSVDGNFTRGFSQYGFSDINLQTNGGFMLSGEANRPVFVDPGQVITATGEVRSTDSRIVPQFGQVLQIGSDLESETRQLSVSLAGITRGGVVFRTSYTWTDSRDQSSQSVRFGNGGIGGATTAGDPNEREWARSSFERRHSVLATISYPFGTALEITAIGRFNSGTPFTPMVGGDINGDGSRNDRAFIFDPSQLAGMDQLLASSNERVRDCLLGQTGSVAARNSCTGPWQTSLDLQINVRPGFLSSRNVFVSLTTSNMLHGIDQLIHGSDDLRGWGLRVRPDPTLLYVEEFDPVQQNFLYSVNEAFGATNTQAIVARNPFQIGIQVRATFGPNRQQQALDRMRGGGRGGDGPPGGGFRGGGFGGGRGGGFSGTDFLERFNSLLVNPAQVVLDMRDSLDLSEEQLTELLVLGARITASNDSIATLLGEEMDQVGTNDAGALMGVIRPRMQDAQRNVLESLGSVREILSDEQWGMVPESFRNAGQRRERGQGPGRRP